MLKGLLGFILGLIFGLVWPRVWKWIKRKEETIHLPPKVKHEAYLIKRDELRQSYQAEMREFDKLIPWVSGGGLFVSVTLIERFAPEPTYPSLLIAGVSFLVACLVTSVSSHYSSSREFSYAGWVWRYVQEDIEADAKGLEESDAINAMKRSLFFGKFTKRLNELTLFFLSLGLVFIVAFAILNVLE